MIELIILGIVILAVLYLWFLYNGLVTAQMRVKESFSGIDVQLKRRSSLIPNLIETVKGYAAHEREVFEKVTEARASLLNAGGPHDKSVADNALTGALKSLFAVAENYPDLKASDNFKQLQGDLTDTEDKIAYSRQFYNGNVMDFNTKIKIFPAVLIAQNMGFKAEEFYGAEEEAKQEVKVQF